jgi:copper transport protein
VARRRAPSRSTTPLLVGGALAACTGTALLGHAGAGPSLDLTRVLASTAHLLAATTWAGALTCLGLLLVLPAWRPGLGAGELRGLLRSFALPAAACVTVMAVTGVYLASDVVGSVDAALRTFYGRTLLVKLALVSCTALLALVNHRHVRSRHDLDTPRRTVAAEAALALAVVAVTAVLTSGQPATEPALVRSDVVATPGPVARQVEDLEQSVSLRPNRPGRNVAVVDVFDSRRPAPAQILGVDVGIGTSTPVPATALEDGHWTSGAVDAAGGSTSITVVVHRAGSPDVASRTPWTVGEAPGRTHAALVSTAPVRAGLRLLAGLLGAVAVVLWGTVLLGLRRRARRAAGTVVSPAPLAAEPVPSSAGDTR